MIFLYLMSEVFGLGCSGMEGRFFFYKTTFLEEGFLIGFLVNTTTLSPLRLELIIMEKFLN